MSNPFNITFGEVPENQIERNKDINLIRSTFNNETPESKVYIISGPRGCGKTALLTSLRESFYNDGYITIDLNPFEDMNEQFAAKLYDAGKLKKLFLHPEFSFSYTGLTFSMKGDVELNNISTLIDKMLEYLKKKNKRVLITIDDVSANNNVKSFVYSFQQMIRNKYLVFFLMSGLYENVSELERDNSLTFFIRAPKLILEPLNLFEITYSYKKLLNLSDDEAVKYAKLSKGYAYGYQLIGSLLYKNGKDSNILDEYDMKLIQNSYSLTWEKLSCKEKEILYALADDLSQKEILEKLNLSNGNFQNYKKKLIEKGIVISKERGKLEFTLPRFKEFVKLEKALNED